MKKVLAMMVFVSLGAHAQIPVTDGAAISAAAASHAESISTSVSQQAETVLKWVEQYKQMENQIMQAQRQFEAITGARGMGNLLNDQSLKNSLPHDWEGVLSAVKATANYTKERAKYPTDPDKPAANAMYDVLASQNTMMSDIFKQTQARLKNIEALRSIINNATDQAAKLDLANRLTSEAQEVQANQNLINVLKEKNQQDVIEADLKRRKEFLCREFNVKEGC